jgi:hypothetical protein
VREPDASLVYALAQVARHNPVALRLAAQLFGCAPCPRCDFIHTHCRCHRLFSEAELAAMGPTPSAKENCETDA